MKITDIWKKQVLDLTKKLKIQYNKTGSINAADVEKIVVLSDAEEKAVMNGWTKDFCPSCGKEMRKWITHEESVLDESVLDHDHYIPVPESAICNAMCITDGCQEQGIVKRAIQNHNNFKIKVEFAKEKCDG